MVRASLIGGLLLAVGGCAAAPMPPLPAEAPTPAADPAIPIEERAQAAPRMAIESAQLSGTTTPAPAPAPPPREAASVPNPSFAAWLREFRQVARREGIDEPTLRAALDGLTPLTRVIELDRRQPESVLTFTDYLARSVNDARVATGRDRLGRHRAVLDQVSQRFGVAPTTVVALWGLESDFGRFTGDFPIVQALATLAWEGRRAELFRRELLAALRIVQRGDRTAQSLRGSWAGAMGQTQFMPSNYLRLAVDFDGDGRRDIWGTEADVFASIANYLKSAGWRTGEPWGRAVTLPAGFDDGMLGPARRRPVAEWQRLGVRRADGRPLGEGVAGNAEAAVLRLSGKGQPTFITFDNFRVIQRWNSPANFAAAVGILSDRLARP